MTAPTLASAATTACPSWCDSTDHRNANDLALHTQTDVIVKTDCDSASDYRLGLARDDEAGAGEVRVWFEDYSLSLDQASEIACVLLQLVSLGEHS